ncbi:MAG: tRNA/rRNA methyltransferase, partial [Paracoccaceae bacterium]
AQTHDTTRAAVADLHYVYATTARPRGMTKTVMTPEAAMIDAQARIARGEKVGILFGRERTGLETDDIVLANAIITVPVNPRFASLNLGQCVLLIAYEWRRRMDEAPAVEFRSGKTDIAEAHEVEGMLDHLIDECEAAHFFWPEDRRTSLERSIRNLFHRAPLTTQDTQTLRGVIRALAEMRRRR